MTKLNMEGGCNELLSLKTRGTEASVTQGLKHQRCCWTFGPSLLFEGVVPVQNPMEGSLKDPLGVHSPAILHLYAVK